MALGSFSLGVRVGPGIRMPQLPALYKPMRRWRLPEQMDPQEYLEEHPSSESIWRRNYATLAPLEEQVLEVLHEQASRGQIIVLPEQESKERYPALVIASLGANRKEKPDGRITARVLFDETNGLDESSGPGKAPRRSRPEEINESKGSGREKTFAVTADVTEAHPQDWRLLGCQVRSGGDVFINTVGTFGVASASYYWSRIAAVVGRLTQCFTGRSATTWHMLVADDFLLEASGGEYRFAILVFFILASVLGIPLSWHKTSGGETLVWVGFELLLESYRVGISQRRADWFFRWSTEVASSPTIHMKSFEEGLGRIMFVAGALEHERPLGSLCKFLTLHPRSAVRRVPPYVSFILNFLSQSVSIGRHYDCNQFLDRSNVAPRVDAQASGTRTGIGGWFPYLDEKGSIDQWRSPWFSMEVTPEVFPWIYERGDKPALLISTLEALAVLMSLKFYDNVPGKNVTMGAKMITRPGGFISTFNFGKNNQDPAKDPEFLENGHNDSPV